MEFDLDPIKLMVISAIVPVLAQAIKLAVKWLNLPAPGRVSISVIAFILSVILAGAWAGVSLPAGGDPMAVFGDLLKQATAVYGIATLAYNIILKDLFEHFGMVPQEATP